MEKSSKSHKYIDMQREVHSRRKRNEELNCIRAAFFEPLQDNGNTAKYRTIEPYTAEYTDSMPTIEPYFP